MIRDRMMLVSPSTSRLSTELMPGPAITRDSAIISATMPAIFCFERTFSHFFRECVIKRTGTCGPRNGELQPHGHVRKTPLPATS
jgi:hypothetical protein